MRLDPYGVWYEQPFVVFDVETTGLDPENDRIVELGVARFEKGRLVDSWGSVLNPGCEIPADATAVHGITNAEARVSPTFLSALPHLLRLSHDAQPVAFNADFDKAFLFTEFERTPIDRPQRIPMFQSWVRWTDPLVWSRDLRGNLWRGNKLVECCERHGVPLDNAHRATADAIAAGELLLRLSTDMRPMTTCELLRQQQPIQDAHQSVFDGWKNKNAWRR